MDYQDKFSQLLDIIMPRPIPADFDWSDEAAVDRLIADAREHAKTDHQVEAETLRAQLAAKDAAYAAEQRMKAAGVKQADIDALKQASR